MAACICEFDLVLENAAKLVDVQDTLKKDPPPVAEFYRYMLEVRDMAAIIQNEPIKAKKKQNQKSTIW